MTTPTPSLRLVIQSGPNLGQELRLDAGEELILGRGRDAHIVIDEAKASRRHTRIALEGGELCIEDLGSINGTFVNGNRITERRVLFPGDSIEVVSLRIRVEKPKPMAGEAPVFTGPLPDRPSSSNVPTMGNVLSAPLTPAKLREMLDFLTQRRKTGALVVHTSWSTGRIWFRDGQVCHASIDRSPLISPRKAVQRLLQAQSGALEFSVEDPAKARDEITASLDELLRESADFPEQFARLERLLPSPDARLVASSGTLDGNTLTAQELEILWLVREQKPLSQVMDQFSGTDTEAVRLVISLTERGHITSSP